MTTNLVLVTGGNGQLGQALARHALPAGWEVKTVGRDRLDLMDQHAVLDIVASNPWRAVINAAAYTAVDRAENDVVTAWMVNAIGPAALASACAEASIPLVHLSTDYVFSGNRDGAWEVDDPFAPLSVYGASKLGGELAVRTSGARHAIVRTAWVVSAEGQNFVKTMLRIAADRDTIRVVDDQIGSPTAATDLAAVVARIAVRLAMDLAAPTGTYHFSNAGAVTWAGFAREIFRQSELRGGPTAFVEPVTTADYPTPAQRPSNSLLSHNAISDAYGITPRPWQESLGDILNDLIGEPL